MRGPAAAACAAVLLAAGCSSQWYKLQERPQLVTTDVVVRTAPVKDAVVLFNGKRQAAAPVRVPVEYNHVEELWARQTNWGKTYRESWSWPMKILGAPVWLVASVFHYREEVRRHTYGGNVHEVSALAPGYVEAVRTIRLEGEERVEIGLDLQKRERR